MLSLRSKGVDGLLKAAMHERACKTNDLQNIVENLLENLDIHPCTEDDLARFRSLQIPVHEMARHLEKYNDQPLRGTFYVAWLGDAPAGFATLLHRSKYDGVRDQLGEFPEMNDLKAHPQGRGIGTAIIRFLEEQARRQGALRVGLGVVVSNVRARALYERLGYSEWGNGNIVDTWWELDGAGNETVAHVDQCYYLVKHLA